jgi:hypothetical protein
MSAFGGKRKPNREQFTSPCPPPEWNHRPRCTPGFVSTDRLLTRSAPQLLIVGQECAQWRSKIDGIGAAGAITAPSGRRRNRRVYRSSAASLQIGRVVPPQRAAVAHTGTTGNAEPDRCSRLALVGRNGSARSRQLGRLRCAHKLRMLRVCPRRRRGGHPGQSEMRSRLGPARVAKEAEEKRLI